jgi:hypothetical protein
MSVVPSGKVGVDPAPARPATAPADLDALPDAVLVVGADGRIRLAHEAAGGLRVPK